MQKIRRATRKHRKILLVVVFLLVVGLVASFAVWNSDDFSQSGTSWDEMTYVEKATTYSEYLKENAPDDVSTLEFADAQSYGSSYMELSYMCSYAAQEVYNEEDLTAYNNYMAQYQEAAVKSAAMYGQAVATAPAELNELGKAQLYADYASMLLTSGDAENAGVAFEQALTFAPDNAEIICAYAGYMFNTQGYETAIDYLAARQADFAEDSAEYSTIASQLSSFQLLQSYYESAEEASSEGDTTQDDTAENDAETDVED